MTNKMRSWFVPPIVIPIGLALAIIAHAAFQALW